MKLGGWMRIYVVIVVMTGSIGLAAAVISKPIGPDDEHPVWQCETSFTQHSAQHYLVNNPISKTPCYSRIIDIANGDEDRANRTRWLSGIAKGLTIWVALMVALFLSGWSLGWIWRGFFPSRSK
ncbi:hypothetical protein ACO2Q2_17090 [Dyella sp. KRB-257]|uniref:hypothetical protein n=1 Tax=Dyella sp. KRB-257 TaxID=3400915 RepID=UPI003BFD8F28